MKKIILLTIIIGIFLISFTSAAISRLPEPVKMNDCVRLPQTCPDCTYNNISTILYPNLSIAVAGIGMSKNGTEYNYTFCLTGELGEYIVNGYGDTGGTLTTWNYPFDVTRNGLPIPTAGESILYSILAFGVLLLFMISFYFMITTRYGNEVNDKGAVIKLTKIKYIKLGLILLTWVLFTWFLNILIGLSDNFVSLTMYYGLFGFIFDVMNRLALPLGIVIIVIALFEIIRDTNIQKAISKFGSSKP